MTKAVNPELSRKLFFDKIILKEFCYGIKLLYTSLTS